MIARVARVRETIALFCCQYCVCVIFTAVALLSPRSSPAQFAFATNNGTLTITRYTGSSGAVVIPAATNGLPIIAIGNHAFDSCTILSNIIIPFGVNTIGDSAFDYCPNLTSVTVPGSVAYIGQFAFSTCLGLSNVTLVDGVSYLGDKAFDLCIGLTNFAIPKTVTNFANGLLRDCRSLRSISVDPLNPVYSSLAGALFDKSQSILLEYPATRGGAYVIPATVKKIEESSFSGGLLDGVSIPGSVTNIADWAFFYCVRLTNVNIPDGVTSLGSSAFSECINLTNVSISKTVTNIGTQAFTDCNRLASILVDPLNAVFSSSDGVLFNKNQTTLLEYPEGKAAAYVVPSGVLSIAPSAFISRGQLFGITIPTTVTNIGEQAFMYCTALTNFSMLAGGTDPAVIKNHAFYHCVNLVDVLLSQRVTELRGGAFEGCTAMRGVTSLDGLTSIGSSAFLDCTNLNTITLGLNLSDLGAGAFVNCASLRSVRIPNNVPIIWDSTFSGCRQLTNVSIGTGVGLIRSSAFDGCTNLSAMQVDAGNPYYSSADGVLFDKAQTTLIRFPLAKAGAYAVPGTIGSIADYAFGGCAGLTNIVLPTSLTTIGNGSFSDCSGLQYIYLPPSLEAIGTSSFVRCSRITNAVLSSGITAIPDYAFEGCTSLTHVALGPSLMTIGHSSFFSCTSLESVAIPDTVTSIGALAFYQCANLSNVSLPANLVALGSDAFAFCPALTSLSIPGGVTGLPDGVFKYCTALTAIYFQNNAPSLVSTAFDGDYLATVYYVPGTSGWGPTFGGRPTAIWLPQMRTDLPSFGVHSNQFQFAMSWAPNSVVVVEACTNLGNSGWLAVSTNTLVDGAALFKDAQWTNQARRFYRLRSQ